MLLCQLLDHTELASNGCVLSKKTLEVVVLVTGEGSVDLVTGVHVVPVPVLGSVDVALGMRDEGRVDEVDAVHALEDALVRKVLQSLTGKLLEHLVTLLATVNFHNNNNN